MLQTVKELEPESFIEIANIFYEDICKSELLNTYYENFDMNAVYVVDHACKWNKISNIGKRCRIIGKDSRIAHVQLEDEHVMFTPYYFYRLEDLVLTKEYSQ